MKSNYCQSTSKIAKYGVNMTSIWLPSSYSTRLSQGLFQHWVQTQRLVFISYNSFNSFNPTLHRGGGHYDPPQQLWSLIALTRRLDLVQSPYEFGHMGTNYDLDQKKVSKFQWCLSYTSCDEMIKKGLCNVGLNSSFSFSVYQFNRVSCLFGCYFEPSILSSYKLCSTYTSKCS